MNTSILIVEDDPAIRQGLEFALLKSGHDVHTSPDAEGGLQAFMSLQPDIVILDVMLPGRSGLELCRQIRARDSDVSILMLTALSDESDRVLGLDLGADDYVTKPFSLKELQARVRAMSRRRAPRTANVDAISFGEVSVDFVQYRTTRAGKEIHLPPKGYGVLQELVRRENEVVTRDDLLESVWGYDTVPSTRTVDNHVAQLRALLEEDAAAPQFIQTVHGVGYRFCRTP